MRFQTLAALRFGFGVPSGAPNNVEAMLDSLGGPDQSARDWPIEGLASVLPAVQAAQAEKAAAMGEDAAFALAEMEDRACCSTFVRAMTGDGFRERLVAFWADHFTVTGRGAMDGMLPYALVEDALRPNLTANFEAMLMQVVLHPAILVYLDQPQSFGPTSRAGKRQGRGLNENLARELLELHTLGVGADYEQADVRAMAELLTGLTYDGRGGCALIRAAPNRGRKPCWGALMAATRWCRSGRFCAIWQPIRRPRGISAASLRCILCRIRPIRRWWMRWWRHGKPRAGICCGSMRRCWGIRRLGVSHWRRRGNPLISL